MRRKISLLLLVATLLVLLSSACTQKSQPSLVGSWTTDLGADLGLMTITFSKDGKVETVFSQGQATHLPGAYKIVDGDMLELTTPTEGGGQQTVQMKFKVEDTKLTLTRNGESQVFYREKEQ